MILPPDAVKCSRCNGRGGYVEDGSIHDCPACNLVGYVAADGEPLIAAMEDE